ncbi:MAG: glutaredoxin 3 [Rhodospirillales bacterium]|mgnify:CR=1 FL=1|jgi:glutaredoxin 3|nr:glutaredoxin 3 [Rhodospirillales bacterium]
MNQNTAPIAQTPRIEIYTSMFCGYCSRAKSLLNSKGVTYEEISIMMDPGLRDEMIKRTGGKTSVPQIFINDNSIGGSDELAVLDHTGRLDKLLGLS